MSAITSTFDALARMPVGDKMTSYGQTVTHPALTKYKVNGVLVPMLSGMRNEAGMIAAVIRRARRYQQEGWKGE